MFTFGFVTVVLEREGRVYTKFLWVIIDFNWFNGFYWALLGFTGLYSTELGCYWVLLSFILFNWVLLGFTRIYWVLLDSTGFYWFKLGFSTSS